MKATPRVMALVLNFNLPDVTLDCVRSLATSTFADLAIVVVDNGSTDSSREVLAAALGERVQILETGENRYFAGGMNVGLRHALAAGCDYALVMNNDTLVEPDMVERLVGAASRLADAGILAPRIDADGRIWSLGSRRRHGWPFAREVARTADARPAAQTILTVDYVTGCAMLLSRRLLEAAGLFDESYVMYYEDADLCERARGAGFGVYVVPGARMTHLVAASARRQAPRSTYLRTLNRVRFYRRHHQPCWLLGHVLIAAQEGLRTALDWAKGRSDIATSRLRGLRHGWQPRGAG